MSSSPTQVFREAVFVRVGVSVGVRYAVEKHHISAAVSKAAATNTRGEGNPMFGFG